MAVRFFTEQCDFRFAGKRKTAAWIVASSLEEGFVVGDISVIFCSSQRHLEINRQFLGHDYHTDIITFDSGDDGLPLKGGKRTLSGDLFVDQQTVSDNAELFEVDKKIEFQRVIIHGVLHLMGYNDKTKSEQKVMRAKEDYYLKMGGWS